MTEETIRSLISLNRKNKQFIQMSTDCFLILLSVSVVFLVFHSKVDRAYTSPLIACVILLMFCSIIGFKFIGIYQSVIRYSFNRLFLDIFLGAILSSLLLATIYKLLDQQNFYAETISYGCILLTFQLASRAFARWLFVERPDGGRQNVAIYGTDIDSRRLCDTFTRDTKFKVVCFIDPLKGLAGTRINGKRVVDEETSIDFLKKKNCNSILFTESPSSNKVKKKIIEKFVSQGVQLYLAPRINFEKSLDKHPYGFERLNIEELLGRNQTKPIKSLIEKNISGSVVLVTGAGGSIGSELCRQIVGAEPSLLILLDSSEHALYEIERELNSFKNVSERPSFIKSRLGLVQDEQILSEIFNTYKIDTIFHAAAYKHVPLVESNVFSAIKNNIFSTALLTRLAMLYNVKNFTLVSSDKAVRPTNIMGASKRVTELVCQSAVQSSSSTSFTIVRFGNVIGSSGSVLPLFKEQIQMGGPVTVTHRKIERYFMAITEAAQLVIQASALTSKSGETFVLDMGEPIKILDLAEKIIKLNGFTPIFSTEKKQLENEVVIQFTGLRPGEKMYEELFHESQPKETEHPDIMKIFEEPISQSDMNCIMSMLEKACYRGDLGLVHKALSHKKIALKAANTRASDTL